jgi:antagonist of KipI
VSAPDVREAGDAAMVLQFAASIDSEINSRVIAIASVIRRQALRGVRDVVPTFRSVAVYFDPLRADVNEVAGALRQAATVAPESGPGRRHEIPVVYGGEAGPDLDEVAARAGISAKEVIRRHAGVPYRVFMLGFQPGFAYLGVVDPSISVPRRATPRLRVNAGSVGIAGRQTAIYPAVSPGGWQIVGQALEPVFDAAHDVPRFAPGDSVVFVPVTRTVSDARGEFVGAGLQSDTGFVGAGLQPGPSAGGPEGPPLQARSDRGVTVLRPGLFTTVQDGGSWGRQSSGFPVSGAMDTTSHSLANRVVGNPPEAPALEVTIVGPELRFEQETTIAVAGADLSPTVDGHALALQAGVTVRTGGVLRFGARLNGARAYIACDAGFHIGRRWPVTPVIAGQVLALNDSITDGADLTSHSYRHAHASSFRSAMPEGGARLRVMRGPQDDQLSPGAFDALVRSRFVVSPQSNRIGYRLAGAIVAAPAGEMISDATFAGGIQVPPSGEPILLMADRQTTGGYPQVATVITADLPLAGQLAPGDWVEFVATTRAEAVAALTAREAMLRDVR